ncbi:MAG: chemotaxis protein CheW [Rhodocyclaceae bacterium]
MSDQLTLADASATSQYLTFTSNAELYAMPIAPIREIIEFPGLTHIPLTPAFLRGVINLRGAVVPVVDLAVRFGRQETVIGRRTCVVIVEVVRDDQTHAIGIIVDAVNEVLDVEAANLEERPGFGTGLRSDFVSSMLRLNERFVVVLDMGAILSIEEMAEMVTDMASYESSLGQVGKAALAIDDATAGRPANEEVPLLM